VGGILSFVLHGRRAQLSLPRSFALLAAGLLLWVGGTYLAYPGGELEGPLGMLVVGEMVNLAGTVLIFLAFLKSDPSWSPRALIYLGKISYGLYVFHAMVLQLVGIILSWFVPSLASAHFVGSLIFQFGLRLLLALALTIGVSMISYERYEKSFLKLKDRFAVIHSRAA
jgi:peptidoglycan/LPS O-acetylase OafA/YrhL